MNKLPLLDAPACCPNLASLVPGRLFRALADPNRTALLAQLAACGRACSVSELAACCPVDLSVVSRHLLALREAGAVRAEKRGREVFYSVRAAPLVAALRALADALESCCPDPEPPPSPSPARPGAAGSAESEDPDADA